MGSVRTAGYAIGEDRTSPRLEAIAGIRSDHVPGWLQARSGSPDPLEGTVRCSRRFSPRRPRLSTPRRAPDMVCGPGVRGRVCGAAGVRGEDSGPRFPCLKCLKCQVSQVSNVNCQLSIEQGVQGRVCRAIFPSGFADFSIGQSVQGRVCGQSVRAECAGHSRALLTILDQHQHHQDHQHHQPQPEPSARHSASSSAEAIAQLVYSVQLEAGADVLHSRRKIARRPFNTCQTTRSIPESDNATGTGAASALLVVQAGRH